MENLSNPGYFSYTVTQSDTVDLTYGLCRAIKVDGDGDIKVMFDNGSTDVYTLAAGEYLTLRVKRVFDTGTSITAAIHAIY
jgi:hypothetical protein